MFVRPQPQQPADAAEPAPSASFSDLHDDLLHLVATSLDLDLLDPSLVHLASTCKATRPVLAGLVKEAKCKQAQARELCARCGGRYAYDMLCNGNASEIHWARVELAAEECVILAPLLRSAPLLKLKKLRLHNNLIGVAGCEALAAAFMRGAVPELQVLGLGSNQIGDGGCVALAEPLRRGCLPQLSELRLSFNDIREEGTVALAQALPALRELNRLYLLGNQMGDGGMRALASALSRGAAPKLSELWGVAIYGSLSFGAMHNNATSEGLRAIQEAACKRGVALGTRVGELPVSA